MSDKKYSNLTLEQILKLRKIMTPRVGVGGNKYKNLKEKHEIEKEAIERAKIKAKKEKY